MDDGTIFLMMLSWLVVCEFPVLNMKMTRGHLSTMSLTAWLTDVHIETS